MRNVIFKYISIILIFISLSACQTEENEQKKDKQEENKQVEDQQTEALEKPLASLNPEDKAEFQEIIKKYEATSKIIDKSAPIQLTMDLQSAFDKIYCKTPGFVGGITSTLWGSSLATCSAGRIAVCGTQGDATEVKPYCVIHDAEADKYYRVLSETPDDHCEDGKKVVCNE